MNRRELKQLLGLAAFATALWSGAKTVQGADGREGLFMSPAPKVQARPATGVSHKGPHEAAARLGAEIVTNEQFGRAYTLARQFAGQQNRRWALDRCFPDVIRVNEQQALGMADGRKARGLYSPWLICLTPWAKPSTWLYELAHHFGEEDEATCQRFADWALKQIKDQG
jgi:hypothetical protein